MSEVQLYKGDCLELMKNIPDKSVDMVLCDLPYGTTACKWDTVIDFEKLWQQYNRVIKCNGVICLFGLEPFSTSLRMSNLLDFKYDWIWRKSKGSGFFNCKRMPLKNHEIISVFYKNQPCYNPQMRPGKPYKAKQGRVGNYLWGGNKKVVTINSGYRYPVSVLDFKIETRYHETQKPVPLLEYLINTYTNEGETVLDNCMGSGSTGVACLNTDRNFIGMELDNKYFDIAVNRIRSANVNQGKEIIYT